MCLICEILLGTLKTLCENIVKTLGTLASETLKKSSMSP